MCHSEARTGGVSIQTEPAIRWCSMLDSPPKECFRTIDQFSVVYQGSSASTYAPCFSVDRSAQGKLQASSAMLFSGCLNDEDFGPAVHGCRENFDFTIKFERIFLSLISASMFIAIAQIRIIFLAQRARMVKGNWLCNLKVV